MRQSIDHIAVLIPAHDEEALLPRCLHSILCAQKHLPSDVTSDIVVTVDQSVDGTLDIARTMLRDAGEAIVINAGSVGVARARAAEVALSRYHADPSQCWLANTDADCTVPENWLADQLALARSGAHAVAGTVDVADFSEHPAIVRRRFHETYIIHPDGTHPHVHGANIWNQSRRLP